MPSPIEVREEFIRNLYAAEWIPLLPGIRGRKGVHGLPSGLNAHMGVDLIDMDPGKAFPLHTHPGAHILVILQGKGTVIIGEYVYETRSGDSYYIPGNLVHGVGAIEHHQLLAFGFPHKEITDPQRMDITDEEFLQNNIWIAQIYSGDDVAKRRELLEAFQRQEST